MDSETKDLLEYVVTAIIQHRAMELRNGAAHKEADAAGKELDASFMKPRSDFIPQAVAEYKKWRTLVMAEIKDGPR